MMKSVFYILTMLGLFGCNNTITRDDFIKEVNQTEEYNKVKNEGDYVFSFRYLPSEFLAIKESSSISDWTKSYNEEKKKFENAVYIEMGIGLKNKKKIISELTHSQEEYSLLIGSLNYKMQNDFYVLGKNNDTIKALYCDFSNTYNNSPIIKLMFVFPKSKLESVSGNSVKFTYRDNTFNLNKNVEAEFSKKIVFESAPEFKELN